jgi:predicted nucleic acid-binding protein
MNKVHRIRTTRPNHKDRYFVDTNVWFWFTYCASNDVEAQYYQLKYYPSFIESILNEGAKLFHSPLIFAELANIIENAELKIFNNGTKGKTLTKKEFREMPDQRARVLSELNSAWETIGSLSTSIDMHLGNEFISASKAILSSSTIDPYDTFYLFAMKSASISKLITDDRDFMSASVGDIYTANDRIS